MIPNNHVTRACIMVACALSGAFTATPCQAPAAIATKTTGFEKRDGFLPIYLDARSGKLLLELPRDSTRALLLISQATGLGSNPIGPVTYPFQRPVESVTR